MTDVKHRITRTIEIDAGHRLPFHGGKCKNMHGHRYKIEAECCGSLMQSCEQEGMVLDFAFLKEEMEKVIDLCCDHGFIFCCYDEICMDIFVDSDEKTKLVNTVKEKGFWFGTSKNEQKIYIMDSAPTAENLAEHWFKLLYPRVLKRSGNVAVLKEITVWETPNCKATYSC